MRFAFATASVKPTWRSVSATSRAIALEAGAKGPPTAEFIERLEAALALSKDDARRLKAAAEASQRKLVIDADMPEDVYWLLSRLRATLPTLTPAQVRVLNEVLMMPMSPADSWAERRRLPRRRKEKEAHM